MSTRKRIAVVLGHPDPSPSTLCHALSMSYRAGAMDGGHTVEHIAIGKLSFDMLRSASAFRNDAVPETLSEAQRTLVECNHLVLIYPLWLGTMPAMLKAFFEQCLRPSVVFVSGTGGFPKGNLHCSVRIIVTMGMPALAYRFYFGAHSLKGLERNILKFCGMGPVRSTLFGSVESSSDAVRQKWLQHTRRLGEGAR